MANKYDCNMVRGKIINSVSTMKKQKEKSQRKRCYIIWRSVEEELPKENGDYVVYDTRGNFYKASFNKSYNAFMVDGYIVITNITHWTTMDFLPKN